MHMRPHAPAGASGIILEGPLRSPAIVPARLTGIADALTAVAAMAPGTIRPAIVLASLTGAAAGIIPLTAAVVADTTVAAPIVAVAVSIVAAAASMVVAVVGSMAVGVTAAVDTANRF